MTVQVASSPVWSKSQMANLKECRRKFFLQTSTHENFVNESARLKKIKNRYLWSGSLVHEEVGNVLKSVRQGSPVPEAEALLLMVREKMRAQFKASRDGSTPDRLFEHQYDIALGSEAWAKQWNTVEQSLRWFLQSKWLARLASLGPECWKAVDEILSFDVGGTKAYVKIDCAVESEGRFFLMDWKTSTPKESSQTDLLVAALYAHEVWGAEADQINASAISLLDGTAFHAHVDEDGLMQTYLMIEEQAALLGQTKEELADVSSLEKIPPADVDTCARCSYQKICHPQGL